MRLEVNVSKKRFFIILGAILLLASVFVVYAYTSTFDRTSTQAVTFGHSADEIVVKMNDGHDTLSTVQDLLKDGVGGGSGGLDVVSVDRVEVFKTEFLSGASVPQKNKNTYYTINMPATIPSNAKGVIMTFVTFSQYSPGVSLYFKSSKVSEKVMSNSISHIDGSQENDYNTVIVPYTPSFELKWAASNSWNSVEKAYAYVDGYIVDGSGETTPAGNTWTTVNHRYINGDCRFASGACILDPSASLQSGIVTLPLPSSCAGAQEVLFEYGGGEQGRVDPLFTEAVPVRGGLSGSSLTGAYTNSIQYYNYLGSVALIIAKDSPGITRGQFKLYVRDTTDTIYLKMPQIASGSISLTLLSCR